MASQDFFISNDNIVWWTGAQDAKDDSYINDATGTVIITDSCGKNLMGSGNSTSYVSASNGNYYAVIDKDDLNRSLVEGETLYAEFTLASSGRDGFRRIPLRVVYKE